MTFDYEYFLSIVYCRVHDLKKPVTGRYHGNKISENNNITKVSATENTSQQSALYPIKTERQKEAASTQKSSSVSLSSPVKSMTNQIHRTKERVCTSEEFV